MINLRNRSFIMVSLVAISFILVFYQIARVVFLNGWEVIEYQLAVEDTQRVLKAFENNLIELETLSTDYARWDDTYQYINSPDQAYIDTNFTGESIGNLKLNVVMLVDAAGEIVFSRGYDTRIGQIIPISDELRQELLSTPSLIKHETIESRVRGLILLSENPLLVASSPVLQSDGRGPINGAVIFGRYLSTSEIQRISDYINLEISVIRFDDAELNAEFPEMSNVLTSDNPMTTRALSEEAIAGYALIRDLKGRSILVFRVVMPRTIYQQSTVNLNKLFFFLIAAGLVISFASSWLMQYVVLTPLKKLNQFILYIQNKADSSLSPHCHHRII